MVISHFINIHSAHHPEFGYSVVGDKCHQLRFMIRCINQATARTFDLVPNAAFYEGGVAT